MINESVIGKATTLQFACQGYNIVLADRQPDRLEATAAEVRSLNREALVIPTDVKDPEQVYKLIQKAIAHFGHVDVLINNADIYFMEPVEESLLNDWQQVINTNLVHPWNIPTIGLGGNGGIKSYPNRMDGAIPFSV